MLQLEGEEFRVDAATNELDLAKRKLDVLAQYTKTKMLTQLESDIQSSEVTYRNKQDNYDEELTKLKEIEDQIASCRVTAPQAGQVVYANVQSSRSSSEFIVEPGAMVRERQVIIRLPDPKHMQVSANINESRINLVHVGMPVKIRIDAFGDLTLNGEVVKVNKYAEPGNWWSSAAKQYGTFIEIFDPPPEIRVGMTAEVQIQVEKRPSALQLPVQAVYERGGKTFCLVKNGDRWDTREVVISSTNDKTVAVDEELSEGLQAGEVVVMNPRRHVDMFDASRFPKMVEEEVAGDPQPAATDAQGQPESRGEKTAGAETETSGSTSQPIAEAGSSKTGGLPPDESTPAVLVSDDGLAETGVHQGVSNDESELGGALANSDAEGERPSSGASGGS
jgi:multidrug efflux pump subunit AcrA (membrane-fusion protein)